MTRLWVVPCRYDPIVHDCVDSIRKHFPADRILLVDSCSPQQSYLDELDVDYVETGNRHYGTGAWERALGYSADSYALIQDSLLVTGHWEPPGFQTVRWFGTPGMSGEMTAFVHQHADRLFGGMPGHWLGMFGPILFCDRHVLEEFEDIGFFEARPTNKEQAAGMERLGGMTAMHLGYDLVADAIQGEMVDFYGEYPGDRVRKVYRDRA